MTSDPFHPQEQGHLTQLRQCTTFQQKDKITAKTLCLDYTLLAVAPKCFLFPLQLSRSACTATHGQQRNKSVSLSQLALHFECEGLADKMEAFIRQRKLPRDDLAPVLSTTAPFHMSLSVHHQQRHLAFLFCYYYLFYIVTYSS